MAVNRNPSAACVTGDVPAEVRQVTALNAAAARDAGQRPQIPCQGGANCWTWRKKNAARGYCSRCRELVDPRDGSLNCLSYPGKHARCKTTGDSLAWLCLPCFHAWQEEWDSEVCEYASCQSWFQCWQNRNPMRMALALPQVLPAVARAPPDPPPVPPTFDDGYRARLQVVEQTLFDAVARLEAIRAVNENLDTQLNSCRLRIAALENEIGPESSPNEE